jgi:hypothetical protein
MFAVVGQWAYWQELEVIQGSTVISIFKNKRMIMIRIGVSFVVAVVFSRKESLSFLNYLNSLSLTP